MLRNPFGKSAFELESFILTKYPFEKTNVFASDDFVKFGWDFVPRLYYQGEKHFDFQNELFVANIANKDIPYIIDGELSLFDVEQKKTVPSVNAFWHGKKFESFSWLPKKNWFLCKFKNEENFYVCDSVSGDKKAKIFFENHDLIIEFINSSGKTVLKPFATSKDFGFNKNSLPIKYIYLSSNGRYLIFNNTKKEFAEKIDFLLSFFK